MPAPRRSLWLLLMVALAVPLLPWLAAGYWIEHWQTQVFSDPGALTAHRGPMAALGLGLLAADSFLPVPSTLVMSGLGYALGTLWGGLVAAAGVFSSGLIAYAACRRFGSRLAVRLAGEANLDRLRETLAHVGPLIIAVTRSVPILQEASSCLAGVVPMPFRTYVAALAVGSIPTGLAYAAIGASALHHRPLAVGLSLVVPALTWPVIYLVLRRHSNAPRSRGDG